MATLKVAITGPEGSGKSLMATALASYFNCPVIEDYCEYYLDRHEGKITEDDLVKIAGGKIRAVEKASSDDLECIISDNELISLKIWSYFKFHSYGDELKQLVNHQYYDLYLLIQPDERVYGNLRREDPTLQNYFYNAYKKELNDNGLPYTIISGTFYDRKKTAVREIEKLLKSY